MAPRPPTASVPSASQGKVRFPTIILLFLLGGGLLVGAWIFLGRSQSSPRPDDDKAAQLEGKDDVSIDLRGEVLISRKVEPSATPLRVETAERTTVVLPAGIIKASTEVTIAKLANFPAPPGEALAVMNAYDVRVGDQTVFDEPLTLEFPYDPEALRPDLPARKAIVAAWWDAQRKSWRITPCEVDEEHHKVIVKTQHLTVWSTLRWMKQWNVLDADNFAIAYKPGHHPGLPALTPQEMQVVQNWARKNGLPMDDPQVTSRIDSIRRARAANATAVTYTGLTAQDLAGLGLPGGTWPAYAQDPQLPPYVRDAAVLLNAAYRKYSDAGFRMPSPQMNVEVSPGWLITSDARNTWTGIIGLGLASTTWGQLGNSAAHELFHAVQNQYYWDFGMSGSRLWWIEASAECAAGTVGTELGITRGLPRTYLQRSPTHVSSMFAANNDPFGEHEYETAHLLNAIQQGAGRTPAGFRAFFEQVVANDAARGAGAIFTPIALATGQDVNLTLHALEVGTQKQTTRSLADHYRDFAAWLAFDKASICQDTPEAVAGPGILIRVPDDPAKFASASRPWRVDLQPNYTAQILQVKVSGNATAQVKLATALPPGTHADVYLLPGNARMAGIRPLGSLTDTATGVTAPLTPADGLYVVAANTSNKAQQVALSVGLAEPDVIGFGPQFMALSYNCVGEALATVRNDFSGEAPFEDVAKAISFSEFEGVNNLIIPMTLKGRVLSGAYEFKQMKGSIRVSATLAPDSRSIVAMRISESYTFEDDQAGAKGPVSYSCEIVAPKILIPLTKSRQAHQLTYSGPLSAESATVTYSFSMDLKREDLVSLPPDYKSKKLVRHKLVKRGNFTLTKGSVAITVDSERFSSNMIQDP